MSADRLRAAAARIREVAGAATTGPWRDSATVAGTRYSALVSDVQPAGRPAGGGWDDTSGYGGYLVAESMVAGDRVHIATWHPLVALAVANWLDTEARFSETVSDELSSQALAVANLILLPHEDLPF